MVRFTIQRFIRRQDLRNNPKKIYLFGDNLLEVGYGGQAKEMRGEFNARGIPTKKKPTNTIDAFFSDTELEVNKVAIDNAFAKIPANREIVLPEAGLGTGRANLETVAPKTFAYLKNKLTEFLEDKVG